MCHALLHSPISDAAQIVAANRSAAPSRNMIHRCTSILFQEFNVSVTYRLLCLPLYNRLTLETCAEANNSAFVHLKRSPAKFVPHLLTNEQKEQRKETCKNMVEMFNSDPYWLKNVITGDETWVYTFKIIIIRFIYSYRREETWLKA
ncbi:hypothetical protein LAZ67_22001849 [Cordylochernes scorpioides]|uniref:Uncharacterized protein n=1 Tax=Cordylochernes scorpioides TaxID=51811 RepID=A0ABY6LPJ3_9ARAC|nr:hypothetical protein LAZ67_22001849 [Cordylochernes scorpioides]